MLSHLKKSIPGHYSAALEPELEQLVVVLSALLEGGPEGQQDDLRVHHEDVEGGALPRVPQHVDQVLTLGPAQVSVLIITRLILVPVLLVTVTRLTCCLTNNM